MANIQPKTSVIDSIGHQNLPWKTILGEFVDNAFDAGATRVKIELSKNTLRIEDNGAGCADVLKMVTLGDRHQQRTTQLGCYGIGAKDAAISVAHEIDILTVHRGFRQMVTCNWKKLQASDSWDIADPVVSQTVEENGTVISLRDLKMNPPEVEPLVKALSLTYSPAIQHGRQIVLKIGKKHEVVIPVYELPPLDHQISTDLAVDGKRARVTIGIIPEGQVIGYDMQGIILSYGYRVIRTRSRIGLGEGPTPNLFGWVQLQDGWELTKNKDNISSNLDALGEAIYSACKETINRAAESASHVVFAGVEKAVNDALQDIIAGCAEKNRKAKRKPPAEKTGAVKETGRGGKHSRAASSQPGATFSEIGCDRMSAIRVGFQSMGSDGPSSSFTGGVVYLNKDIPAVAAKMNDPEAVAVHAIYSAASYLAIDDGLQKRLFLNIEASTAHERMTRLAGMLLSRITKAAT